MPKRWSAAERPLQRFGDARLAGDVQRLDIAVADHRNAAHARRPRANVIADAAVPALRVDRIGRLDLVAHPPHAGLVRRIPHHSVREVEARHVAARPDEAEHHELAQQGDQGERNHHHGGVDCKRTQATARRRRGHNVDVERKVRLDDLSRYTVPRSQIPTYNCRLRIVEAAVSKTEVH
jgi:hypothetical protein